MLAEHFDPTMQDNPLQQGIGQMHNLERPTFDTSLGTMFRAFTSQERQGNPPIPMINSQQGCVIVRDSPTSHQQHNGLELPIAFTLAHSEVRMTICINERMISQIIGGVLAPFVHIPYAPFHVR